MTTRLRAVVGQAVKIILFTAAALLLDWSYIYYRYYHRTEGGHSCTHD